MEARGDELVGGGFGQQVSGELQNGKPVERDVLVQCPDYPVPIWPDRPEGVLLVTHRVCVAGKIKPHACPALAEGAGIQQSIHQGFVRIGRAVGHERIYRFGSGRETGQVKRETPDERVSIRLAGRMQSARFDSCQHEAVDWIPSPGGVRYGRWCLPARRLECPVPFKPRTGIDPPAEHLDLVSRKTLSRRRHWVFLGRDSRNDTARGAVSRYQTYMSPRLTCGSLVRV